MRAPPRRGLNRVAAPFRILALSGGGYQGLYTAQVLTAIEAAGPGPLRDRFDLISGTSVGGIIALALAAGVPAARVVRSFLDAGPALFPNGAPPAGRLSAVLDALRSLSRPKYDPAPLREMMGGFPRPDLRLCDLPVEVLIPATRMRDGEPVLFSAREHGGVSVIDAALATSAAPMMFPTHRIGDECYADGAIFATAPDLIALGRAQRVHGAQLRDIHMLSVGTLNARFRLAPPDTERLGVLGWIAGQRLVRTVLASQERLVTRTCVDLLGERYLRLDAEVSEGEGARIGLDVATPEAQKIISRIASETVREIRGARPPFWGGRSD